MSTSTRGRNRSPDQRSEPNHGRGMQAHVTVAGRRGWLPEPPHGCSGRRRVNIEQTELVVREVEQWANAPASRRDEAFGGRRPMPRDGVSVRVADNDRTRHVRRGRASWPAVRRGPVRSRGRTRSTADEEPVCRARARHTSGAPLRAVPSRGVAAGLRPEPSGVARLALPPTVPEAGRPRGCSALGSVTSSRSSRQARAGRSSSGEPPHRCWMRPGFLKGVAGWSE